MISEKIFLKRASDFFRSHTTSQFPTYAARLASQWNIFFIQLEPIIYFPNFIMAAKKKAKKTTKKKVAKKKVAKKSATKKKKKR